MSRSIRNLKDVVDWGLCIGCGACAYACKKQGITLVNVPNAGIRPRFDDSACASCTDCLSVCPGYTVDSTLATGRNAATSDADREFGPALEIWEGYAADPEIRFRASSGGMLTALSLYCLERENMGFVLHAGMDADKPWLNRTHQSRTRAEVLAHTGSRYAPASPCEDLQAITESDRPCVFVGKPCDTTAVALARRMRPELDAKLGLVLTFFCAGTPSTNGTLDLLRAMQVKPGELTSLRYRGEGWPGRFRAQVGGRDAGPGYSYEESWGALTKYRPARCHLCPDGLGRVADISCGDAWNEFERNGDPGRSLVLVRTERGRQILAKACEAGYVTLRRVDPPAVLAAQVNLLARRREIFGRLLARRLLLMPVPQFIGFSLFHSWLRIPFLLKCRTVAGSITRLIQRGLWRPRSPFPPPAG